ncbi:hypothetical protein AAG906_024533 [Vitis piasezkii]
MATKTSIFSSVISGSPMITSEKLVGSENYLSWSASVELWFMGQGYEDHLVTQEADIPEVDRIQWRKIDAQLCSVLWQSVDPKILLHLRPTKLVLNFGLRPKDYTRMISSVFIRWLLLLSISANKTWIYLLILVDCSLKEEFLTVMPLTPDVGAQQTRLDKFFMVLTLIGLRPDLEPIRDRFLVVHRPSLDMCLLAFSVSRPLGLCHPIALDSSLIPEVEANVLIAPIAINLATLAIVAIVTWMASSHRPYGPLRFSAPQPPSSSASRTSQLLLPLLPTGNASAALPTHLLLDPWILDSSFDHISCYGSRDCHSLIEFNYQTAD